MQSRLEVLLLLTAAFSATLLSSVDGQTANPAQVGREVSRTQRPAPVQTGPAQTGLGAPAAELPQREEYGPLKVLYNTGPLPTFSFQTFAGAFYTNNAALLPSHEIGEWYFQQGYALGWSKPFLQSTLFPHTSLYQAWFEYVSYRYAYYDYAEGPRADSNHTFALSLVWRIRPMAFLQLGADYVIDNSNIRSFNYRVFNGGPTTSINIQW